MKIQRVQKALEVKRVQSSQADTPAPSEAKADVVKLSGASKDLSARAMQASPEKVNLADLKAAISSGEYKPDLDRLADRLLTNSDAISSLLDE